jgi:predicted PurR-regulated permease PerM
LKRIEINLQELFFLALLLLITIGFYSIIKPFLVDIFLAIILSILFKRPHAFFCRKFQKKPHRAATYSIVLVFFTIVIPLTVIAIMISGEIGTTYDSFMRNWPSIEKYFNELPEKASSMPIIKNYINDIDWNRVIETANQSITTIAQFLLGIIQETFINVGIMIVHFFIILFLLYFILIDGKSLVERIQYLIPLKDTEEKELMEKFERVTDAIVFNSFMIGFIEGAYGGLLFLILGIPSPFFWGMMMTFLSIIPVVGANSILVPMGIYQILTGHIAIGIIIIVLGAGAIVVNQNLIRPRLDGNKSGMHPAIMFVASMGGLITMGIVGFLVGPMIAGLFVVMWNLFGSRYKQNLEKFNKGELQ